MFLDIERKDVNKHQLELALYGMSVGDACLDATWLNLALMNALSLPGASLEGVHATMLSILEREGLMFDKSLLEESSGISKWVKKMSRRGTSDNCEINDFLGIDSGSLKWITPLAFYLKEESSLEKRMSYCHAISSVCYEHPISEIACHYFVELLIHLLKESNFNLALSETNYLIKETYENNSYSKQLDHFRRILNLEVVTAPSENAEDKIDVVYNLELAIWAVATSDSYEESVTKIAQLDEGNQVALSLTGVLSGICFGEVGEDWVERISNKPSIDRYISLFCE